MSDWLHAVEKLTRPWSDVLSPRETDSNGYVTVDYAPLLTMLDDACRSNTGNRGGNGADPSQRSLIDVRAFDLREHIDGTVRSWVLQLSRGRVQGDLKTAVIQLAGLVRAHHASQTITDTDFARVTGLFPLWVEQVWGIVDPPNRREVQSRCPKCLVEWMPVDEGSQRAVWIEYRESLADAAASCRACGASWVGLVALREIGIDASEVERGAA